jgi:BirA family transcriptional regulator, biotin operon repressor / biotin---[acetyl-CoA-carboxylase] ligase
LILPPWFTLAEHESLASTNDEAKRLAAEDGAPDGTLVWAHSQTAGRGRQNRLWISEPGNLFCSVLLRPDCAPARAAEIGFAVPLAGLETLASLSNNLDLSLKWPNDILAAGKKVGGILMESSLRDGAVDWVVAGIGLNLASHPDGTEFPATSLKAAGATALPEDALAAFCSRFEHWYGRWREEGFQPICEAWLAKSHPPGTPLRVRRADGDVSGAFHGLDESGALLLDRAGKIERLDSGDVFFAGQE